MPPPRHLLKIGKLILICSVVTVVYLHLKFMNPTGSGDGRDGREYPDPDGIGGEREAKVHPETYIKHAPKEHENIASVKTVYNHTQYLKEWKRQSWCTNSCKSGIPCEYKDEVDFRIIVLVANRPDSLLKCLDHIADLDMGMDRLAVDIWIDVTKEGMVHEPTLNVARGFAANFTKGRACYHPQTQHSYIANMWLFSYRPKNGTREVAMILEDDIDISRHTWKWYKALHNHFRFANYIAGYSLKGKDANIRTKEKKEVPIRGNKGHTIVLYNCFQAWGYSPNPSIWRKYQEFYMANRKLINPNDLVNRRDEFEPTIEGSLHTYWYNMHKGTGYKETLAHEMWNVYYTQKHNLYTVYSNLNYLTGREDVRLCENREEKGLHYDGDTKTLDSDALLLKKWDPKYAQFPKYPDKYTLFGERVKY